MWYPSDKGDVLEVAVRNRRWARNWSFGRKSASAGEVSLTNRPTASAARGGSSSAASGLPDPRSPRAAAGYGERPRGERDAVFAGPLHACGRHGPSLVEQVDFGPARADRFARACGREDQKFHGEGRDVLLLAQACQEGRQLSVSAIKARAGGPPLRKFGSGTILGVSERLRRESSSASPLNGEPPA
jgi:hypothetical protein